MQLFEISTSPSFNKIPSILILFQLSGLFLIITGGVVQGAYSQYLDFLGDSFFSTPVFLIIVGCIIFFVAFFGCCGAIKENHCMTLTFAILLGMIFLMEIGAGIAAYKLKGRVRFCHTLAPSQLSWPMPDLA